MAVFVDPKTGERYENVPEDQAERAQREFGLQPLAEYELQQQHGGFTEQLKTIPETAVATGARLIEGTQNAIQRVTGFGTAPGLVPEAGSLTTAETIAPSIFTPEARARREANPTAATIGSALPAVIGGIAAGAVAPVGALGLVATEGVLGGALGEAGAAAADERPMTAEGVLYNGALGVGLAGIGTGLSAAYRAVAPRVGALSAAAEKAIQSRLPRSIIEAGEDLSDPIVGAKAAGYVADQTAETMTKLDEALSSVRPVVDNNPVAQKQALQKAAESLDVAAPEVADQLRALMGTNRHQRFQGLVDLETSSPEAQQVLESLSEDTSLWGDKAVTHAKNMAAARAARDASPSAYAEALRSIDDPTIQKLVGELDDHLDAAAGIEAAQAFRRPRRSVGAAGDVEEITETEAAQLVAKEDEIKQSLRDLAGGTSREHQGVVQEFNDTFQAFANNQIKREDFREFAARMPANVRERLASEAQALAGAADEVASQMPKGLSDKLRGFVRKVEENGDAASLDELKNAMQAMRKKLARTESQSVEAQGLVQAIDNVEPRIRQTLENPDYVGEQIAELQKQRNEFWSNPETGYIRNQNRLKAAGYDLLDIIEHDYDGRLLLQTDRRAIDKLISDPTHLSRPALDALEDMVLSAQKMAQNTVETSAKSAAFSPFVKFNTAAEGLLDVIRTTRKLNAAKDIVARTNPAYASLAKRGLSAAQGLPYVGTVISAARAVAPEATEAAAAKLVGEASRKVTKEGVLKPLSTDQARRNLSKLIGPLAGVAVAGGALSYTDDASAAQVLQQESEADLEATARALTDPEYADRWVRRSKDVPGTLEQFQGVHETLQQAYEERRAAVEQMGQNPDAFIDTLAESFGALPGELRSQIAAKAFQISQYLQGKLPPVRGVSVTRPKGLPPSALEIRKFALQYTAATDPSTVFDDAKRGRVRHEQIDTLRDLWPDRYEQLRTQTLLAMGQGKSSITQRQRADLLFDFGEAMDPAFSPRLAALAASAREKKQNMGKTGSVSRSRIPAALQPGGLNALSLGASAPVAQ